MSPDRIVLKFKPNATLLLCCLGYLLTMTIMSVGGTETNEKKLKISLYYESMCPGCMAFDKDQLYPLYSKIPQYLDLDLVPYGNAEKTEYPNGTVDIQCQHGPKECQGNRLHACAIAKLPQNVAAAFVGCTMSQKVPPEAGYFCAKKLNLTTQYRKIVVCAEGAEGEKLVIQNGIKTDNLNPPHQWVPWVIFDDKYSEEDMKQSMNDLVGVVCRRLTGDLPNICNQVGGNDYFDHYRQPNAISICSKTA